MDDIYHKLEEIYNTNAVNVGNTITVKKQIIPSSVKSSVTHELLTSNYIALPRTEIEKIIKTIQESYEWTSTHFIISVWMIPPANKKENTPKPHWDTMIRRILLRLESLYLYYQQTSERITFTCVPFDVKRELPISSTICVKPEHINGGFTFIGLNEVYIFRKEEYPKVILHEYLHQVQGNQDALWLGPVLKSLYEQWNISMDGCLDSQMQLCRTIVRPNEAIVEFWAWVHQIQFLSIEYGIPWRLLWDAEYEFIRMQSQKLIHHQHKCNSQKWSEETHAFSYHVLKGFFAWCFKVDQQIPVALIYSVNDVVTTITKRWSIYWNGLQKIDTTKWGKDTSLRMTLLGDF